MKGQFKSPRTYSFRESIRFIDTSKRLATGKWKCICPSASSADPDDIIWDLATGMSGVPILQLRFLGLVCGMSSTTLESRGSHFLHPGAPFARVVRGAVATTPSCHQSRLNLQHENQTRVGEASEIGTVRFTFRMVRYRLRSASADAVWWSSRWGQVVNGMTSCLQWQQHHHLLVCVSGRSSYGCSSLAIDGIRILRKRSRGQTSLDTMKMISGSPVCRRGCADLRRLVGCMGLDR